MLTRQELLEWAVEFREEFRKTPITKAASDFQYESEITDGSCQYTLQVRLLSKLSGQHFVYTLRLDDLVGRCTWVLCRDGEFSEILTALNSLQLDLAECEMQTTRAPTDEVPEAYGDW